MRFFAILFILTCTIAASENRLDKNAILSIINKAAGKKGKYVPQKRSTTTTTSTGTPKVVTHGNYKFIRGRVVTTTGVVGVPGQKKTTTENRKQKTEKIVLSSGSLPNLPSSDQVYTRNRSHYEALFGGDRQHQRQNVVFQKPKTYQKRDEVGPDSGGWQTGNKIDMYYN